MHITSNQERYRNQFENELAQLIGCEADKIPPTVSKDVACKYLGIKTPKTLDVWKCNGRHEIVMLRVGRYSQPATDWLINFKLFNLSIAEAVA